MCQDVAYADYFFGHSALNLVEQVDGFILFHRAIAILVRVFCLTIVDLENKFISTYSAVLVLLNSIKIIVDLFVQKTLISLNKIKS